MSLLDVIRIAEPCTEAWSSMTGNERARHCSKCDKTVFDLSALTRAEAEALLAEKGANMCGRYRERSDGTIVMADCLVRRTHRRLATVGALAALAGGAAIAMHEPTPDAEVVEVSLPDEADVTVQRVETSTEDTDDADRAEHLKALEQWRLEGNSFTGGAVSFDRVEEATKIKLDLDAARAAQDAKALRDVFSK